MESIKKLIDDIEKLAYSGKNKKEICQIKNCSEHYITNAINELNDPISPLHNVERYELLKEKFNDNLSFTQTDLNSTISYKERLAIIEPLIMNEGMTYQEIEEVTGLTNNQINYTIAALNRPKTDIYDEEKYKMIKDKVSENAKPKPIERIKETEYQEYLDKIEYQIENKYLMYEICNNLSITEDEFHKIFDFLNNPNSSNYNPSRYKRLKAKLEKNVFERRAEISSINEIPNFVYEKSRLKLDLIKKVANGEMNVYDAANELHMHIYDFFLDIINLKDVELKDSFRTILQPYGVFLNEDSTKNLMSYPIKTQKEIVLMALTYRVSYKTLTKLFGVSMKNVIETFKTFNDLALSLDFLFLETYCEDEINEKKAYSDAKKYWKKRNELITSLNEARKNSDGEQAKQIKIQIDELRSEINDKCVLNLKGKKATDLTEEEKDLIAKYQLKYYLSSSECGRQFGFDKNTIQRYSINLAERNPIFAEKMVLHHKCYQEVNERCVDQYKAEISRGGGSR